MPLAAMLLLACFSCRLDKTTTDTADTEVEEFASPIPATDLTAPAYSVSVAAGAKMTTGFHSYVIGVYQNYWVVLGGRTNGFHGTEGTGAKFPRAQANDSIFVIDTESVQGENATIYSAILPEAVRASLTGSNMGHEQVEDYLYTVGGYGTTCDNGVYVDSCYQTFPYLTRINLPGIVNSLVNDTPVQDSDFFQVTNDAFRVAGGEMYAINDLFYVVFGQNYQGVYKPGRTGTYTERITTFQVNNTTTDFTVSDLSSITDPSGATGTASQFHRRDLNVTPAVRADGSLGLEVYGGVFNGNDEAYQQPISIDGNTTTVHSDSLLVGLYECGQVLLFDRQNQTMFTTLLGGIGSHRYDSAGKLVPDNDLPFVKTISTVIHNPSGEVVEYIQPASQKLPGWIGANSIFIPVSSLTTMPQHAGIIDLNALPATTDPQLIGYMLGGIHANGAQTAGPVGSYADNIIYNVYLTRQ